MRIILFGIPEFGSICLQTLLNAKKNIVAVAIPPINHPAHNIMKATVDSFKIPTIKVGKSLKSPQLVDEIKSYKPDIIVIAAYSRLIPSVIYEIPPLGTINSHPSLLPQYRGPNPYFHVIRNAEPETGITFHYLDDSFDTGDIIYQCRMPLLSNDTIGTVFIKLSLKSSELYVELLNKIERGEKLPRVPQPKNVENLKIASEINVNSAVLRINWNEKPSSIDCLVRAANPFFGAYTLYKGVPLKILTGTFENSPFMKPSLNPGTIVKVTNDKLAISAGSGVYYPTAVHYGLFYITDIRDFIKRMNPKVGEVLT